MKLSKISEFAQVSIGQGAPQNSEDFSNEGNPFIRAGSLEALIAGKSIETLEFISNEAAIKNKMKLYPKNAIVFAKSGMSATKNRVYKLTRPSYVVSHLAILLPNEKVDSEYLRLVVQFFKPSSLIKDLAYPSIGQGDIENFQIPLPPLPEQIHIANVLSKTEVLIAKRKESLALLDAYLKSTFLEMFGDPVRNEKGWEVERLNSILVKIESGWSPVCDDSPRKNITEWGILKLSAVTYDFFNPKENKKLKPETIIKKKIEVKKNDLLFARKNTLELVGSCAFVFEDFPKLLLSDLIFKLIYDNSKVNGIFLWKLLCDLRKNKQFHKIASGTAGSMPNISQERLMSFKIIFPPLELQNQFALVVEKVEVLKGTYQESLRELEALYGSLSQRAFRGELGGSEPN